MNPPEQSPVILPNGIVILRYWQILLLMLVQLLGLGAAYGRITTNQENMKEEMERRFEVIEGAKVVSRDEFDSWRQEFQQNLRDLQQALIRANLATLSGK